MTTSSPIRLFATTGSITIIALLAVLFGYGWSAMLLTLILVAVEVAFSFDNAIINARVLRLLSPVWQKLFLTIGVIIAVFGMRILFPLAVVAVSAHLSLGSVWNIALHHPVRYSAELGYAHPAISAFGGGFLLLLALNFFLLDTHEAYWLERIERRLQRVEQVWIPAIVSIVTIVTLGFVASKTGHDGPRVAAAGIAGIVTYLAVHGLSALLGKRQRGTIHKAEPASGWVAFGLFMYLEILDASFSFDGVVGAFAITDKLILIAVGLGVGALWVRSLTVYMVRQGALSRYIYLEHGAHYTIAVVAVVLLLGVFVTIPNLLVGLVGIGIIYSSFIASKQALALKSNI
jgi:hypothetical protein